MDKLRFGILSTASINEDAILPMPRWVDAMEISAVASRTEESARKYADKHGIAKAYGGYDALIADPDIDCVYIPVPNAMHKEWSLKALGAGKHVLCEKPMSSSEAEAREVADKVKATGLTYAEAFHYRYHPLAERVEEIVRSGEIGELLVVSATFNNRIYDRSKVQMDPKLSGGALMDTGCYPVSFCRWIAGCDEAKVVAARSMMTSSGVDGTTRAILKFDNGVIGRVMCSIDLPFPAIVLIEGSKGSIFLNWPYCPAVRRGRKLVDIYMCVVRRGMQLENLRVPTITTYHCQMRAFCDAVHAHKQPLTNAEQGVLNMRLIDAIYEKSGGKKNW